MLEQLVKYWLPILAIILSVASFIYTLIIYRNNRRLSTAQRYNYGLERFASLSTNELETQIALFEKVKDNQFNAFEEKIKKHSDDISHIEEKFIKKYRSFPDKIKAIEVEKFIAEIINADISFKELNRLIVFYAEERLRNPKF